MSLRSAEVCAGYNGLGMAVEQVFGSTTAWFSEFDAAPSKILAHHYPGVPNHGDMTLIDWAEIEQVDILAGGTPCQDLSHAGRRKGMTEGTRSNLWVHMREAIAIQKPTYVVWENVRGAYSAEADSELEFCPRCMGNTGRRGAVLRALGRVLGDLSDLGYDTQWRGLRAADVGACHGRFRVFVLARLRDVGVPRYANVADVEGRRAAGWGNADPQQSAGTDRGPGDGHRTAPAENADIATGGERRLAASGQAQAGGARADASGRDRTPPTKGNGYVSNSTPWWADSTPDATSARRAERQDRGTGGCDEGSWARGIEPERSDRERINWGEYEPAIRRWERVLGRPSSPAN